MKEDSNLEIRQLANFDEGVNLFGMSKNKLLQFFNNLQYKQTSNFGNSFHVLIDLNKDMIDKDYIGGVLFLEEKDMQSCSINNILCYDDESFNLLLKYCEELFRDIKFNAKTQRSKRLLENNSNYKEEDGGNYFTNY